MKHLILGSDGQIGWHLKEYLRKKGEIVLEFDIVRDSSEDLRISNNDLLREKVYLSDFVHFLAFDVGGSNYMQKYQDSYNFISNNVKIMNNVFDIISEFNNPFIFASSQMSNMLHSSYGILKMIGEKYTGALGGIVVKFWNVYGYEKDPEKAHVITDFIKTAVNDKKIIMKTNGLEERQFLYGDDAAECLYILSTMYSSIDRINPLHITSFEWTKIIDIARIISEHNNNCEIITGEFSDNIQRGMKNEPNEYILQFWKPRTKLEEGIIKASAILKT